MPPIENEPRNKVTSFLKDLAVFAVIAIVIVIPIRLYVAQPFVVSGSSMYPTFENGQYLVVNQLTYHFEDPVRGQVVIFKYPLDTTQYFIKRIIGLPGETVSLEGSNVNITTREGKTFTLNEPYVPAEERSENMMPPVKLGDGQYFVMGDNRRESSDSRIWGTLPRNLIVGTPLLRLLPLSSISVLPGNFKEPAGEQK
jgi:signal peptidase I